MKFTEGKPVLNGVYVVYVLLGDAGPFTTRLLCTLIDGVLSYMGSGETLRSKPVGFIGPLPCVRVDDSGSASIAGKKEGA